VAFVWGGMYLNHLSLTQFRNFARLDLDVPKGAVMLLGANAQGKTSLLESIYYLATFASFHATNDRQLINFLAGQEPVGVARIIASFHRSSPCSSPVLKPGTHRLEVRIIQEANGYANGGARVRREVILDGADRKLGETIGAFNAVLFLPQTLRVLEGAPEERRRYLNLTLGQVQPHYAALLSTYSRGLTQRNALLKQLSERGGDAEQLRYWDEQLALNGAQLIHARIHAVQGLERLAARIHRELTHGEEILRFSYEPAYDPLPRAARQYALPIDAHLDRSNIPLQRIQEGFLESLRRLRSEELARGVTTIGPHRDELRFLSNGLDLGIYGSRGQVRTAVLSLKLAEVMWMKEKTGEWPVLLLDEVLAELDSQRRLDLLNRLLETEQILLTTTDLDLFTKEFASQSTLWRIDAGRVFSEPG
jgi:DNA replication and repair protein RecF